MLSSIGNVAAWQSTVHSLSAWVLTLVLAIAFPALDWPIYFRSKSKLAIYAWNICAEWSLVVACAFVFWPNGLRLADLGEQFGNPSRTFATLGVLVAIAATLSLANRRQSRKPSPEQMSKAVRGVRRMLPVTGAEQAVYVAVALTAGLCEEFLYRGWLLNLFGVALGSLWLGLLISSIIFGFAHIYQGRRGVIGTGVLGIVFGLVFLVSGSLIPGQILHVTIDVYNGLALGKAVRTLENTQSSH